MNVGNLGLPFWGTLAKLSDTGTISRTQTNLSPAPKDSLVRIYLQQHMLDCVTIPHWTETSGICDGKNLWHGEGCVFLRQYIIQSTMSTPPYQGFFSGLCDLSSWDSTCKVTWWWEFTWGMSQCLLLDGKYLEHENFQEFTAHSEPSLSEEPWFMQWPSCIE